MKSQSQSLAKISSGLIPVIIFLFTLFPYTVKAQVMVDCDVSMACNDTLQVSLEETCNVVITPSMVLEDPAYPDEYYTVTMTDKDGYILPDSLVDGSYEGEILEVSVSLNSCGTSCWGVLKIEDKLPPLITNCDDITISCTESLEPGVDIPALIFNDPCSGIAEGRYYDEVEELPCEDELAQIVTRTWIAEDEKGNVATCVQLISVLKSDISTTVFPPNYDNIEEDAFECTDDIELLENGAPSPEVTGYPTGVGCSNIQYYFDDIIFPICGASIKVLRQWTIVDWCNGVDTSANQIIKILDTQAPVCTDDGQVYYETSTTDKECTGMFEVPHPTIVEECSDYTYIVGYKPVDDSNDPFTDVIYPPTSIDENGVKTIYDIPIDTSWLVYTITDACGHVTQCYNYLVVKDTKAPTAICEGFTVITLDNLGNADLIAESIDDGSWDNCGIVDYKVKREQNFCGNIDDLQFQDTIYFCCEDTKYEYIMVTLRVYDAYGNHNDCRVQVKVQDKIPPVITCPIDTSINCTEDVYDLDLTGRATATDACPVDITYEDIVNTLNDCGVGYIIRRWTATDRGGRTDFCDQRIDVTTENIFSEMYIEWPKDVEIDGCTATDADPEGEAGKPKVTGEECVNIAIAYEDQMFYESQEYCIKILRTWKVADWCTFDKDNPHYYTHVQKIGLTNSYKPVFQDCYNVTTSVESCEGYIELIAHAEDDCTPASNLGYRWEIDIDNDTTLNYTGKGNDASGIYPAGTHKITFYAVDECDNEGVCTFLFTILDTKAPTPICLGEVVWALDNNGQAVVWASDFDLKSTDGCSDDDDLIFSFTEDGLTSSMSFDCSDVPNGIAQRIPLKMYVIDESGNSEFCGVDLILQDSKINDACVDDPEQRAAISGMIINEAHEGLEEVEVKLENMKNATTSKNMTDIEGRYAFEGIGYYNTYDIQPLKDDDITNGVSTLDLVLIQQHILGLNPLDSPYKMIAADVNNSASISAADLVQLRKVILGVYNQFQNNTSWRFIPSNYEFEEGINPWDFPQGATLEELMLSEKDIDFIAIKTGDVNGTATAKARDGQLTSRSLKTLNIQVSGRYAEGYTTISFYGDNTPDIMGMQFTLDLNENVNLSGIKKGALTVSTPNFGIIDTRANLITFSWDNYEGQSLNDQVLFEIVIDGKVDPEKIDLNSEVTKAEAYDIQGQIYHLELENLKLEAEVENYVLYQNNPNPFDNHSQIKYYLPESTSVTFTVHDLSGKEVFHRVIKGNKGMNNISLNKSDIGASGVMFYRLNADNWSETRKMIILE